MPGTFGEKFEEALAEKRRTEPLYGLRTLARKLAKDDLHQTEIIRRRLNKYRPPKGGGNAKVSPTEPTRWEIEKAMGLKRDALKPEPMPASQFVEDLLAACAPLRALSRLADMVERGELVRL